MEGPKMLDDVHAENDGSTESGESEIHGCQWSVQEICAKQSGYNRRTKGGVEKENFQGTEERRAQLRQGVERRGDDEGAAAE